MNHINTFFFREIISQPSYFDPTVDTKLNQLANICFSPLHYLNGRTIQVSTVQLNVLFYGSTGPNYSHREIFDELRQDNSKSWLKTVLAIALLVPSILIGSVFKSLSLFDTRTRERFFKISNFCRNHYQLINPSSIYIPVGTTHHNLSVAFSATPREGQDTQTINITKKNDGHFQFGVVVHYNGRSPSHQNAPFYNIQLANPTPSDPRRSIWDRITYPINHNLTDPGKLAFINSTSFSFTAERATYVLDRSKVKVEETDTNNEVTLRYGIMPEFRMIGADSYDETPDAFTISE